MSEKLWPDDSWFDVRPDTENCILCTACVAVCQEGAITIADNQFTVDKTKCSGCMSCRDVCFPKAIRCHTAGREKQSAGPLCLF